MTRGAGDGGHAGDGGAPRGLHSGFFRHAALSPDAVAFTVSGTPTTYGEAAEAALRLAAAITDALGHPAMRVGILGLKSATAYEGMFATLAMGGCFVPLHPHFPAERTRAMAMSADLDAIIADAAGARRLRDLLSGLLSAPLVVLPDEDAPAAPPARTLGRRHVNAAHAWPLRGSHGVHDVTPADLAYLLFTSGSTGSPKGVPITHGAACNFIDATLALAPLSPLDRVLQASDPTFDLSIAELFPAWEAGARTCALTTEEMLMPARCVARDGITTWVSTPSRIAYMRRRRMLEPGALAGVRLAMFCGEPLPLESAAAFQAAAPDCTSWNFYGPTEATVWCTAHRYDPAASPVASINGIVPIGTAMTGTRLLIVDERLRPVPAGEDGELCLSGIQLTPGYWRAPDVTGEAFFELGESPGSPGAGSANTRWYRTGDRARELPSGELAHLGRLDGQVKVHGYRIELGEVEHVLRQAVPGLSEIAVVTWPWRDGAAAGLVAFGAGEAGDRLGRLDGLDVVDLVDLKESLRDRLPAWATPSRLVMLEQLPRNASGKIDRLALVERLRQEHVA